MIIKIEIKNCYDCKFAGHSGAFTPGGSIPVCNHSDSPRKRVEGVRDFRDIKTKEIAEKVFDQRRINNKYIPVWCPLKNGASY